PPAAGVRPRRLDAAGSVVRRHVGRRLRVFGCRCDLAGGGSGPGARPVGPGRLNEGPRGGGGRPLLPAESSVALFFVVGVALCFVICLVWPLNRVARSSLDASVSISLVSLGSAAAIATGPPRPEGGIPFPLARELVVPAPFEDQVQVVHQ